jgi:hypothetical protein
MVTVKTVQAYFRRGPQSGTLLEKPIVSQNGKEIPRLSWTRDSMVYSHLEPPETSPPSHNLKSILILSSYLAQGALPLRFSDSNLLLCEPYSLFTLPSMKMIPSSHRLRRYGITQLNSQFLSVTATINAEINAFPITTQARESKWKFASEKGGEQYTQSLSKDCLAAVPEEAVRRDVVRGPQGNLWLREAHQHLRCVSRARRKKRLNIVHTLHANCHVLVHRPHQGVFETSNFFTHYQRFWFAEGINTLR